MKRGEPRIAIVSLPLSEAAIVPLSHLVDIMRQLTSNLHLMTGYAAYSFFRRDERVRLHEIRHDRRSGRLIRLIRYILAQVRIAAKVAPVAANVDVLIFFIGAEGLVLPMLTAKLLRKKVVIACAGSLLKVAQAEKDPLARLIAPLQGMAYHLADRLVLYSESLIKEWGLEAHKHKISIARDLFIDLSRFTAARPLQERDHLVGYVGRLSQEKGILNFLEGIPKVAERRGGLAFLIGGDGPLRNQVEEYARMNEKVRFEGWVTHDDLPDCLNQLRLLVIPSYTEAGPYIAFEAMACGTPVLGTPVGLMADMITDGETGFIMKSNSPECIAESTIRALSHPNLEQIAENARALVAREFTYDRAVETYRRILEDLLHSR